jgi:flagellar protein FlaF
MQSAAQAYGSVARQIASPRELEAQLLLKAAARLQTIREGWSAHRHELADALLYNRKLWSVLLAAVTSDDNPLPAEIRQNVANIGLFVMNRTVELTGDPRPEALRSLITINREIAAGLLGRG